MRETSEDGVPHNGRGGAGGPLGGPLGGTTGGPPGGLIGRPPGEEFGRPPGEEFGRPPGEEFEKQRGRVTRQPAPSAVPSPEGDQEPVETEQDRPVSSVDRVPGPSGSWNRPVVLNLLALATLVVLLAAGVALAGALVWPKTYAARAEVLYPITREQPTGFLREDRSMTTQLVLLRGRAILGPIAQQQGRTVEDLQQHVTATVLDTSEVIQLQVTDRSPERARQTTQQVLDRYLEVGQPSDQPTLRQRLEAELAAANTALRDIQTRLTTQQEAVTAGTATADTVAPLQTALQAQQERQQQLQAQLDSVNLAPVAQLLTPPYPVGVVSPRPVFVTMTGGLLGVMLAAGIVALVARNRTRQGGRPAGGRPAGRMTGSANDR